MIFWPCCCPGTACFKPCECFQRGCELHITSSGWTDNAATDCGGIADRVFNKTHVFTISNIVGTAYGYDCEFTISYDDLILTKEVGGNCICKTQPALYNIEGTLGCTRNEEGGYNLTLVLHFNVPVYDEDEGCSPSPCTIEPKWETWTANYELVSGGSSSAPPCDLGPDPLGPYTFNTTPSAQTTCGLGLDGTNAEFTLEWKFCDPQPTCCFNCCGWDESYYPDYISVTIDGVSDGFCDECSEINGTYVLERSSGTCNYLGTFDVNICGRTELYVSFTTCDNDNCIRTVVIQIGPGIEPLNLVFSSSEECPETLDGEVLLPSNTCNPAFSLCCHDSATATIGIPT